MKGEEYGFKSVKTSHTASPFICLLLLGWLSHQDGSETVKQSYVILNKLMHFDIEIEYLLFRDIMHFIAFFAVGFTIYSAMNHIAPPKLRSIITTILIVPVIAFADEFHQSFIPGRTPSLHDFKLDLIGGGIGLIGGMIVCFVFYEVFMFLGYKNNPVH